MRLNKRTFPYNYGETESAIGVIVESKYIIFVMKKYFYLDLSKTFGDQTPIKDTLKLARGYNDAFPATDTGVTRTLEDNRKIKIFSTKKDDIWIDEKNFKYFDLDQVHFKGTDKKSPLYVFDNVFHDLVGVILPVNHT